MPWNLISTICLCTLLVFAGALDSLNSTKDLDFKALERKALDTKPDNPEKEERIFYTLDEAIEKEENNRIPESLLIQMKDIKNASEFLQLFVLQDQNDSDYESFGSKTFSAFGNQTTRRGLAAATGSKVAQFAGCQPENQVMKLEEPEDSGAFLWPPCVRLRKCGGCCTSKMLTCRPTKTSQISITVLQVRYNGPQSNAFRDDGSKVIELEQHERCACGCKQQPEHCSQRQEFKAKECRCICKNQEEALSCNSPGRIWDSGKCACVCRTTQECSTGFYFNIGTCRCEAIRASLISRWRFMYPDVDRNYTKKTVDAAEPQHRVDS